jgi:hypothetical protein
VQDQGETASNLTELRNRLCDTELRLRRLIELQGKQIAEKSEELKEMMVQTQQKTDASGTSDLLGKYAMVALIRSTIQEQLNNIQNPPSSPGKPTSVATAGLLAAMLITAITSGLTAAVVIGRKLSKENVVPRESFDLWLHQWKKRTSSPYECIFWFLDCGYISSREEDWKAHVMTHFQGTPPPDSISCMTCRENRRYTYGLHMDPCFGNVCTARNATTNMAWDAWMSHIAEHLRAGQKVSKDQILFLLHHLRAKGVFSDDDRLILYRKINWELKMRLAMPVSYFHANPPNNTTRTTKPYNRRPQR